MAHFQAERIIYGKLAGVDREHMVIGQSLHWPSDGGVPKSVGIASAAPLQGACSLDWHQSSSRLMLALSWCEAAPRITGRDFCQAQHIVIQPEVLAPVLPFLPEVVAKLREIPVFDEINNALAPFVFEYPPGLTSADEVWIKQHWCALSSILAALLEAKSVFIRGCATIEEKLKIIAALMLFLPGHMRPHLTFSTDEYGRRPKWRRVTFSAHNRADLVLPWPNGGTNDLHTTLMQPMLAGYGRILASEGLAALIAETGSPKYRHLSFDSSASTRRLQTTSLRLSL